MQAWNHQPSKHLHMMFFFYMILPLVYFLKPLLRLSICWVDCKLTSSTTPLRSITQFPYINTLRPRQNGRHFADDTFNRIFVNENVRISIKFPLKFVPKGPIHNIPALVQIMAWRRPGDKPLSEPVMVSLLTHICVTRPQWVKWGNW